MALGLRAFQSSDVLGEGATCIVSGNVADAWSRWSLAAKQVVYPALVGMRRLAHLAKLRSDVQHSLQYLRVKERPRWTGPGALRDHLSEDFVYPSDDVGRKVDDREDGSQDFEGPVVTVLTSLSTTSAVRL